MSQKAKHHIEADYFKNVSHLNGESAPAFQYIQTNPDFEMFDFRSYREDIRDYF